MAEAVVDFANEILTTLNRLMKKHRGVTRCLRSCSQSFGPNMPKCYYSIFLLSLMHLKVMHKWINRLFDMLCDLLKMSHLDYDKVPHSYYNAKKEVACNWAWVRINPYV